jgi:hypothetical protein
VSERLHAAAGRVQADLSRGRAGAPSLPGDLRRAQYLHRAGRPHPDPRLRGDRVHHRPAGAELGETEARRAARELRPSDGHGDRDLDSGARSTRSMPHLWKKPCRRILHHCWRLPAAGGAAGWLGGDLRSNNALLSVSTIPARAASRGGYLLRARGWERTPVGRAGGPLSDFRHRQRRKLSHRGISPDQPVGLFGQSKRPEYRAHRPRP